MRMSQPKIGIHFATGAVTGASVPSAPCLRATTESLELTLFAWRELWNSIYV